MLPSVDVDVVVAVHDLARRVDRTVLSALRGADLAGVLPGGYRVRVTVACHELSAADVRQRVEQALADEEQDDLTPHVRYLEVRDGLRSPAGPFNAGLAVADGRYVSLIGSDDRYAEGALGAWVDLADRLGSAWLMPRLETDTGEHVPTPRTRPGRSRDLDLVQDRLAYRTAPLGLLRRQALVDLGLMPGSPRPWPSVPAAHGGPSEGTSVHSVGSVGSGRGHSVGSVGVNPRHSVGSVGSNPRHSVGSVGDGDGVEGSVPGGPLTPGLATGEDVELSLRLAASGERVDYAVELPSYVIGTGAGGTGPAHQPPAVVPRTSETTRPLADELAAHARLLDQRWLLALPAAARRSIVVKTLRIHVLAAVRRRPSPLDWAPGEAAWLRALTHDLLAMAPEAERALHRADRALLAAVLTARDTDALARASAARARAGRWDILLAPTPLANLDHESTVRQHLDAALARTSTRGRELLRRAGGPATPTPPVPVPARARPRVLVLSFSPVADDARVLKQVRHLAGEFDVVTCGYGPPPPGVTAHVRVPDELQNRLDGRLITLRAYRAAYRAQAGVRWVRANLAPGTADVVLANDLDAVPLALALRPRAGVHADLHEYFPRLHEEHAAWMRRISPYQAWLCRTVLPRCRAVTTVSHRIAQEYAEQFGVEVGVVTNAAPYADLPPRPVGSPLRLVHSGACLRNRDLHVMVDAVVAAAGAGAEVTLDLYLTANDPGYLEDLRARAAAAAGVVTVHPPVPYASLVTTLNRYDVGVHVLPPSSFNNANALPNKIFDYVQARLGLLVGPSPEMARLVHRHSLGVVATAFDAPAVAAAVVGLDAAGVTACKRAADTAARELSDAEQSRLWVESVREIAGGAR